MRILIATLALLISTKSGRADSTDSTLNQPKARQLLDSGFQHFKAHDYKDALQEFHDSFDLDPTLLAAAMSAHAQANVDRAHPSAVLEWIGKGLANASGQVTDSSIWAELSHACEAAKAATHEAEEARATLEATNQSLQQQNAELVQKVHDLENRVETFSSVFASFQANVPTKDWSRLTKDICLAGKC